MIWSRITDLILIGSKPHEEDNNPYIKAWWEWWPEVSKTLQILRLTGGEPLMHKSTWRLFEELHKNPLPHLELNVNSNMGVKSAFVENLAANVNLIREKNAVKQFALYTSIDCWNGARRIYSHRSEVRLMGKEY